MCRAFTTVLSPTIPQPLSAAFARYPLALIALPALQQRAQVLGIHCFGDFKEIEALGQKLAVIHGDDQSRMQAILNEQRYDSLSCGHAHVWRDERVGRTRIINPGALKRTKDETKELTCALLDLRTDRLEKITIG